MLVVRVKNSFSSAASNSSQLAVGVHLPHLHAVGERRHVSARSRCGTGRRFECESAAAGVAWLAAAAVRLRGSARRRSSMLPRRRSLTATSCLMQGFELPVDRRRCARPLDAFGLQEANFQPAPEAEVLAQPHFDRLRRADEILVHVQVAGVISRSSCGPGSRMSLRTSPRRAVRTACGRSRRRLVDR